jgi:hypothetical protein
MYQATSASFRGDSGCFFSKSARALLCCCYCNLSRYLGRDEVPDETSRSFHKRELVCQAALKQNTNRIVSGHVGRCYQRYVLGNPKMDQVVNFG